MTEHPLPEAFRDLERFMDWSLPTERERMARRESSPMDEIVAFHGAMSERLEEVVAYVDRYAFDELPEDVRRLRDLALSLVEVAPLVEMYKDPGRLRMLDSTRFVPSE